MSGLLGTLMQLVEAGHRAVTWQAVMSYGAALCVTYVCHLLFVKPFLSPLRKMPGMTYIPLFGNMSFLMAGEAMEATIKMMKMYGGIVRYYFFFGSERIMVSDPDILKHILVTNSRNYIKPPDRMKMLKIFLGNGLVLSEGAIHAAHKRLMSPFFNNNAVKKMVHVFEEQANVLVGAWKQQITTNKGQENWAEISVQRDLGRLTLDIVGKTAFGYDFNSILNPEHEVCQAFNQVLTGQGLSWRLAIPFYTRLRTQENLQIRKNLMLMKGAIRDVISAKGELISRNENIESVTCDVLGMMMMAKYEETGEGMTPQDLQDETMTLMLAGHETTAVGLSWAFLLLSQHPEIQERAREEIMTSLPPEGIPLTWESLEELSYIGAVVKETLRMYPPVPLTLRQAVDADTLGKYPIPANSILMLAMGGLMRNPEYYSNPDTFNPDRFLTTSEGQNLYHFLPFVIGSRMCLGYKFALMEMKAVLVTMLRHFKFEAVPGVEYKRRQRITMRPHPSLTLRVSELTGQE